MGLMEGDMANGSEDIARQYQDAAQAQLGERVTNLGRRVTDIEGEMRAGFRQIEASISALSTTLAERNKPHWQALGVALTFAALIGGLAYMPIREATSDLKSAVAKLAETAVTRDELAWRAERAREDRLSTEKSIAEIRAGLVPRAEHERVWTGYDQRFADMQRQIDETKANLGNTYSLRDYIQRLTERIDRMEDRRAP